jgi:hypothetical protein
MSLVLKPSSELSDTGRGFLTILVILFLPVRGDGVTSRLGVSLVTEDEISVTLVVDGVAAGRLTIFFTFLIT